MMKFYVKCGVANQRILVAKDHLDAAVKCAALWISQKRKLSTSIHVSETGFGTLRDHPDHEKDVVIPTTFAKSKIKKKT
jgi:hypothetical protein